MTISQPLKQFQHIVTGADENINLVEAALLIANNEYPELNIPVYQNCLDRMTEELRGLESDCGDRFDIIQALNHYLYEEQGFTGNLNCFNDPRNSFFNDVLDRKLGIPITLSVLYMELGNRIGLSVKGIAFPGHFLVKVLTEGEEWVLDPFSRGILLDEDELQQRLRHFSSERRRNWKLKQLLEPASNRQILARMLRNLKNLYFEAEDFERALKIMNFLLVLSPDSVPEIRDRAYIHDQLDCFRAAIDDYQQYLMLSPQAEDTSYIQSRLADLKQSAGRLH